VGLGGAIELHAAFREESRTSLPSVGAARSKSGKPGFPVGLGGAIELHAALREESRTSLLSAGAARRKFGQAKDLFVVFSQGKPLLVIFIRQQ
jgi:hypothetical protein